MGHGTIYALATVAPVLVALLVAPLVTRLLGAEQYGVVGVAIALYQTGAILLGAGLSAAITRHAIIADSGVPGAVALVYSGAGIAISIALAGIVSRPAWAALLVTDDNAAAALTWPVLSALGLAVLTLSQSVFRAQSRVVTFVTLGIASALVGPVVGLVTALVTEPDASNYLFGLAVGHIFAAIASLLLLGRPRRRWFRFDELRTSLRIGLPTVPHSVASSFLTTVVVVMASQLYGIEEAGRAQLAIFIGTAPLIILGAFNNSWAPMIYRASDEDRPALLSQSSRVISVIVLTLVTGFVLLVGPVAHFIAGPSMFTDDLPRFALIVSIATPWMALYLMNINEVFRTGQTGMLAITTPSAALAAVGIALLVLATQSVGFISLALVLPVFHATMWLISMWLRSRTGSTRPQVAAALPGLAGAAALPLLASFAPVPLWLVILVAMAGIALLTFLSRHAIAALR